MKFAEIENSIDDELFFIVETQLKQNRIRYQRNTKVINKMRDVEDRKGGGIMVVWKHDYDGKIEEIKTRNSDLMLIKYEVKGKVFFFLMIIIGI